MKVVAVGALVLAAIIYVFAFLLERDGVGWAGYVRAAAERGMVGALADWFAVTALFKRPLGLPIPAHRDHSNPQERDWPKPRRLTSGPTSWPKTWCVAGSGCSTSACGWGMDQRL